jgi:ERF superfamily
MPRSSESVAALASALAKAQAELVNPEKSLTATIRTGRAGEGGERSFRYAPLSSGLDIVRKTLGQHEIATVQTTALDQAAGLVNLTTMLAHASGEWIASDWPVCAISDMAYPQRMGAALTYARRYALFTLVGIAGEDDLDAPDLHDRGDTRSSGPTNGAGTADAARNAGMDQPWPRRTRNGHGRGAPKAASAPITLAPEQSAAVRDRLLGEVAGLPSADQATGWAREVLSVKNSLTAADARAVEDAFERKLSELVPAKEPVSGDEVDKKQIGSATHLAAVDHPPGIDKSVLAPPEPKRYRNKEHLQFVAKQACLICGRKPSDPHHLRFAQSRALGRKVSDEFTVPLCRVHHSAVHRVGDERGWWKAAGIDPVKIARRLWKQTRLDDGPDRQGSVLEAGRPQPPNLAAAIAAESASFGPDQRAAKPTGDGRTP